MSSLAIRILCAFLPDAQLGPRTPSFGAEPGEVATRKLACPDCGGEGIAGRFRLPCVRCGGVSPDLPRGLFGKPGRGWVLVDAYTVREAGNEETGLVSRELLVMCDGCGGDGAHGNGRRCGYCLGTGRRSVPEGRQERDAGNGAALLDDALGVALTATGTTTALTLRQRGSFAALEQALRKLEPSRYAILEEVCIRRSREDDELAEGERALLLAALREVAEAVRLLEGRIRVPGVCRAWYAERRRDVAGKGRWANGQARERRDADVVELRASGLSQARIAGRIGVSQQQVSRLLARAAA